MILGAHYDVHGNQKGADDNASGVAGLIEIARILSQEKTKLPADKYPSVKDADGSPVSVPYKATVNKQTELLRRSLSG